MDNLPFFCSNYPVSISYIICSISPFHSDIRRAVLFFTGEALEDEESDDEDSDEDGDEDEDDDSENDADFDPSKEKANPECKQQ